jgi:MFS family permease
VIPFNRWGEAMGIHGLCFSTGMAIGPAIGSAITSAYSLDALFYCSSVFALLSILILVNLKETLPDKQKFVASHLTIGRGEIIEKQALPAAIVTFLSYFGYGAIVTLIPDWSDHLGMGNKGLFFMTFTIASLLIRVLAGKVSDQYGRVKMLMVSLCIVMVSLIMIGLARTPAALLGASVVYGIGSGILSPAVSAWTVDLSNPQRRGMATATMYIALEAGIGLGALMAGWMFQDVYKMVPWVFYICALIALLGFVYLRWVFKPGPLRHPNIYE